MFAHFSPVTLCFVVSFLFGLKALNILREILAILWEEWKN